MPTSQAPPPFKAVFPSRVARQTGARATEEARRFALAEVLEFAALDLSVQPLTRVAEWGLRMERLANAVQFFIGGMDFRVEDAASQPGSPRGSARPPVARIAARTRRLHKELCEALRCLVPSAVDAQPQTWTLTLKRRVGIAVSSVLFGHRRLGVTVTGDQTTVVWITLIAVLSHFVGGLRHCPHCGKLFLKVKRQEVPARYSVRER